MHIISNLLYDIQLISSNTAKQAPHLYVYFTFSPRNSERGGYMIVFLYFNPHSNPAHWITLKDMAHDHPVYFMSELGFEPSSLDCYFVI